MFVFWAAEAVAPRLHTVEKGKGRYSHRLVHCGATEADHPQVPGGRFFMALS